VSETPSEITHDAPSPVRLSPLRQSGRPVPQPDRKSANLSPDPREWGGGGGRRQEQAFSAFTNRIHHQSRAEAHLEREHSLTKHLLHKINASRLLPVQVPLRGASDLNYQECYRKQAGLGRQGSANGTMATSGTSASPAQIRVPFRHL